MNTYFEHKKSARGADLCYSRKPVIDEREIHPYHEILYYLDGGAMFICDGFTKPLSPHTLILIPKGCYHFLKLKAPSDFERLKISFNSIEGFEELSHRHFSSIRIFENPDENTLALLDGLCKNLPQSGDRIRDLAFTEGSLLLLLASLESDDFVLEEDQRNRLTAEALRYIERNLTADLSSETMSRALGVSSSTLSHTFKAEMGISLHKYVTQKRIAYANRLISDGNSPTKIYSECGYGDYSSFYKAYVRFLGHPPSLGAELPKI